MFSNVLTNVDVPAFCIDGSFSKSDEEATESVNPGDQGLLASDPSESVRSESHAPAESNEALLRIYQDMARVLERLTAMKAPIDMVRRHGAEEFHGSNMEESDKGEFWLEKLQRIVEEVRCPPDQRVTCAVSLLQGSAYDWWKLVLRSPRLPSHTMGVFCPRVQGQICL